MLASQPWYVNRILPEIWYKRAAEYDDHPDALYDLARIILVQAKYNGSVEKSKIDSTIKLLRIMVENGNPYAAIYLGTLYLEGDLVTKNLIYSEYFLRFAVEKGFVIAMVQLSRALSQKGCLLQSLFLRLKAMGAALSTLCRNVNDEKLFLMHQGFRTGNEEFPGWQETCKWPRFG